jgi:AcrR family transcriptional regulator
MRQKEERKHRILRAADTLFSRDGFQGVSMEKIAEKAEVGVATVYNYFGTKGRLLHALLRPEADALYQKGAAVLAAPPDEPSAGMSALLAVYRGLRNNWAASRLLQAISSPGLTTEAVLDDLSIEAETMVKQHIGDLLRYYQVRGKVTAGLNIVDASAIIFAIFNQHFLDFIASEVTGFSAMAGDMDRRVALVVGAWETAGGSPGL